MLNPPHTYTVTIIQLPELECYSKFPNSPPLYFWSTSPILVSDGRSSKGGLVSGPSSLLRISLIFPTKLPFKVLLTFPIMFPFRTPMTPSAWIMNNMRNWFCCPGRQFSRWPLSQETTWQRRLQYLATKQRAHFLKIIRGQEGSRASSFRRSEDVRRCRPQFVLHQQRDELRPRASQYSRINRYTIGFCWFANILPGPSFCSAMTEEIFSELISIREGRWPRDAAIFSILQDKP